MLVERYDNAKRKMFLNNKRDQLAKKNIGNRKGILSVSSIMEKNIVYSNKEKEKRNVIASGNKNIKLNRDIFGYLFKTFK